MNKEVLIKLLNKCLSSDNKGLDKEKLQVVSRLLEKIKGSASLLQELDFDKLKECCQVTDDEIQELSFYMIMCQLQDSDYQLTEEQIKRIKELINKYLEEIKGKLVLIDKNQEKDNYVRKIIKKISQDRFILSMEELENINRLLKDKKVEIVQINQIMISLSLVVISELERQLNEKDVQVERIDEQVPKVQEVNEESVMAEEKNNRVFGKDEYIYKLDDILTKYNYWELREKIVNDIDNLMKVTTLDDIEYILKTVNGLGRKVNEKIVMEMIYHSSKEVIDKVLKITTKLSGQNEVWCFNHLYEHVSIFMKDGEKSSYQDFMKNMYMFEEINLSTDEFMLLNMEILCINHKRLKKNVLILEKYKIPRTSYLGSVSVLKAATNLYDELDIWLELGNSESRAYLENRLSILVANKITNFKNKLRILRNLGLSITINESNKSLNKWLFEELDLISSDGSVNLGNKRYYNANFIPYVVKNEEYEKLLRKRDIELLEDKLNECELYQKFVNNVECVNNLYYRIPGIGIKISKNKVHRVFNTLINNGIAESRDMLVYAITYNSAITKEEYDNVCDFVDQILGNKLEHKGSVR